jgi:predicted dehydrogenase
VRKEETIIGIVGAGKIATDVHIPVLRTMSSVRIAWIADRNAERARAVAAANRLRSADLTGGPTALPRTDIVLLAIPLPPRRDYFDVFAQSDTAVLAEKPLALSAREHKDLADRFEPWRLAVGYQRRTYATSRFLQRAVDESWFGTPRQIRIREGARTTRAGDYGAFQDESVAAGGGITLNLGCHSLDLALWMTGANAYSIVDRKVTWDGETDRRATANIRLFRREADRQFECPLLWTVSWIDQQPNTVEVDFDGCTLSAPIASSKTLTLARKSSRTHCAMSSGSFGDKERIGLIDVCTETGAASSDQAFYLEWQEVIESASEKRLSKFAASTSFLTAQLMDELLER